MKALLESIAATRENILEVTDLFYQQKNNEGFSKLNEVLLALMTTIDLLFAYKQESKAFDIDENILNLKLSEAMQAMEIKDTVLLADILRYDILEQLNDAQQHI